MHTSQLLKQMFALLGLVGALWVWHLYGRVLTSPILLLVWGLASLLLGLGLWQSARTRRRVWLAAYLLPESSVYRLLRGGLWMALLQILFALVMALYLLLAILSIDASLLWTALLLGALALPVLATFAARLLRAHTVPQLRTDLSLRVAIVLLSGVLFVIYIWHAFNTPLPDFRNASLEQAVWYGVSTEKARSPVMLTLLELGAATDGLRVWLAQRLLPTPGTSLWQAVAWSFVLAREALFVWSYLLLCRGTLALSDYLSAGATEEANALR